MAGSQEDTASGFPLADQMTGSRCAQDAILTDDELLHTVRSTDLRNDLCDFWIPVPSITTNDQCAALCPFWYREDDCSNEVLTVVRLLKDLYFLSEARSVCFTV